MPRLPTYTAKVEPGAISGGRRAGPEDTGVADLTGAVRAVQGAASSFLDTMEQDETRAAIVENQRLRTATIEQMRAAELEGKDITPLLQKYEDGMSDLQARMQTKRGIQAAEQYGLAGKTALFETARVIDARRSGQQMANSAKTFDAEASRQLQTDPTALGRILAERDALVSTYAGRVPPELLAKMRSEGAETLTAASVNSVIENDPALAERLLRDEKHEPWGSLTPQARATLINTAQAAVNARDAKARIAEADRKREQARVGDQILSDVLTAHADGKLSTIDPNAILRRTDVDPDRVLHIFNIYKALAKPPQGTSTAATELYRDIFRPPTDPRAIRSADQIDAMLVNGAIDPATHRSARQAFLTKEKPEAKVANQFISRIESIINPRDAMGRILSPDGGIKALQFRRDMERLVDKFEKDPKVYGDSMDLYDPSSKAYARYVAPLVQQYRPDTLFVPDDKGGLQKVPAPTATDMLPVVKSQKDFDALPAGAKYRAPNDPPGKFRTKNTAPTATRQIQGATPLAVDVDRAVQEAAR